MFHSDFVSTYVIFQRDFVALGENQTHNFVARHKLGFHTTSSLCLGIELVGVRVRARVRIPRQIRRKSGANPAQRVRNDPLHTTSDLLFILLLCFLYH